MAIKVKIIRQMTLRIGEGEAYKSGEVVRIPQELYDKHPSWFEPVGDSKIKVDSDA